MIPVVIVPVFSVIVDMGMRVIVIVVVVVFSGHRRHRIECDGQTGPNNLYNIHKSLPYFSIV